MSNHDNHFHEHDHEHTLTEELAHHLPYAIFSVALGLAVLSFLSFFSFSSTATKGYGMLFHSFHFMHIVFASTGSMITFLRFSDNIFKGLLVSMISTTFFCIMSDAILPYLGGELLGVSMHFHLCFVSELHNVLPFLFVGLLNGVVMSKHHDSHRRYSLFSHFIHIFVSSLASIFYLVSQGFFNWYSQIGIIFLFLIVAVIIPCTLSDVVVPMAFARSGKKNEKHKARAD